MSQPASLSTRRRFLQGAATALSAPFILPSGSFSRPLNSMLQLASIGVDGMGYGDLKNLGSHPKVKPIAFCDIDSDRFKKADKDFPNVPHHADYMEMLEKLGDTVDAVNVAIPDHSHARAAIHAMRRGKHVYCQKPLAHTVWECRQMRLWAAKTGVITQMGNQIHSNIEYRLAVRLLQDGAIGKIKEIHSWVDVDGRERTHRLDRPGKEEEKPVPANVNWELWIGPAPMRPFVPDTYHPFVWRDWQDFGSGALGDFGCHILDPIFTALDLHAPISLVAENAGTNHEVWPGPQKIHYVFPGNARTAGPTLPITWYDGRQRPDQSLAQMPADLTLPKTGSLIIGEAGNLVLPHIAGPRLYPQEKFSGYAYPHDVKGASHWHVWVDHVFANEKTTDGFHYAGPLAETVQLGNIASRLPGQTLSWDAEAMHLSGHPDAAAMLTTTYRPGYEVPAAPV